MAPVTTLQRQLLRFKIGNVQGHITTPTREILKREGAWLWHCVRGDG